VAKAARRRHPAHVIPSEIRPIVERMGRVGVHLADQAGLPDARVWSEHGARVLLGLTK
jgi:hypothetical protein